MQTPSAEVLIESLRESGLFTPEQFVEMLRELAPLGSDSTILMRHLLESERLSAYQLRKVVTGKAAELFLGPYVISDKLGEGGMGRVYRATQIRVGREVALKVIRPSLIANPIVRGRYDREAKAAERLEHPNIVRLLDADEVNGQFYLALEFIDGLDLARLVKNHGVLSVPETCEYMRQAALGLQHAHEQGFIHRDIKPSNIVVSGERHVPQARGPAHVKLLDMGLVRGGFEESPGDLDLTRDGTVVGTPDYMAPEQAKNSSTVDHRADLYGLGCTFYLLLTGKPPFPDGNAIEKLFQHQTDAPQPLQSLRHDVPPMLAHIVARLMAKKPADRFHSAGELAMALIPLAHYGSRAYPIPGWVAQANPADTLPPSALYTPIPPPVTTPRPVGHLKLEAARPPVVEASPFDFPPEAASAALRQHSTRMPRPSIEEEPQRSRSYLVIAAIVAFLLVLAAMTWVAVKYIEKNRSIPSTPTEVKPTIPIVEPPAKPAEIKQPVTPVRKSKDR